MKSTGEGIFIQRIAYSETSLITTFYTRESGIQRFMFRGGKKKAHQIYPLSCSELHYYGRPGNDLLNLTEAEPLIPTSFQFNPVKSSIAFFIAETVSMAIRSEEKDEQMYDFLKAQIIHLDRTEKLSLFPAVFLIELTRQLGISPLIENSFTNSVFDLSSGLIGGVPAMNAETTSGNHVTFIINQLQGADPGGLNRIDRDRLIRTLIDYYRIHIPGFKEPGTYEIVKEVLA